MEATLSMARATNIPIVASGGIRDLGDIKRLLEVSSEELLVQLLDMPFMKMH